MDFAKAEQLHAIVRELRELVPEARVLDLLRLVDAREDRDELREVLMRAGATRVGYARMLALRSTSIGCQELAERGAAELLANLPSGHNDLTFPLE